MPEEQTTHDLTVEEAREFVAHVRASVEDLKDLIVRAVKGRAWIALGYGSWDEMCEAEFDGAVIRLPREDRREAVASLREAGLSTRAIGSALGISNQTVGRDLSTAPNGAVEPQTVTSLDGRERPASQPARTQPLMSPPGPALPTETPTPVREVIPADDEQEIVRRANEIKRRQKEERQREHQAALDAAYAEAANLPPAADLRTGDFREVLSDLDGTVDAVITDPPYPAEYLPLYGIRHGHDETDGRIEFREDGLAEIAHRLLKPGGICAVMVGQSYLPEILERMTDGGGLTYHWTLAYLTPGGQAVQLWQRKVNTFWKPILVFTKGEYTGAWFGDVAKSDVNDNDKRFHEWGQSESGMVDLIERLTKPGDLIVDPFLGAGTTGVAALATGRRFTGCDIDADHVAKADARIRMAAA